MYVKFRDMITALSGLLGLLKVRRTPPSKTPHLTSAFDMLRNFQTKYIGYRKHGKCFRVPLEDAPKVWGHDSIFKWAVEAITV